jgi:cytochrome c-type biogenesis protein
VGELLAAFVAGMASTAAPCVLPLYPGFVAYLTGSSQIGTAARGSGSAIAVPRLSPLLAAALVLAGVMSGMLLIAGVVIILSASLSRLIPVILPLADVTLILLGLLLLVGINPFARLPAPAGATGGGRAGPATAAFLYGLLFAPIAVPCIGPFLLAIFAFSLTVGDVLGQLLFFAAFGLGFGVPLFVIGVLGQWQGAQLALLIVRFVRPIQLAMGLALVVVGAWDLSLNLPALLR